MSVNRRRKRRQHRGHIRQAGAFGGTNMVSVERDEIELSERILYIQALRDECFFRQNQGKRTRKEPAAHKQWRQTDVDRHPARHGKRKAGRDVHAGWGGWFIRFRDEYSIPQYCAGEGLAQGGRFGLYVQGDLVGFTDDGDKALGFTRAAKHRGLDAYMGDHG